MEQTRFADDLLLQLFVVYVICWLDKECRRWAASAYHDTLLDEMRTCVAYVFFNGTEVVA